MILRQSIPFLLIVLMLLIAGCARAPAPTPAPPPVEVTPAKEEGELKRVVEVEADGLILHYLRRSFWGEAKFSEYLANQADFKTNFKEDFEQGLAQSDVSVSTSDYSFSFDSATESVVIRCNVHGAISKREDGYHATFFWLLKPLGLDFIDNDFEESEKGLFWEGLVDSVPTTVSVKLPVIDSAVYKAWSRLPEPGHCHAHVWWPD